jgi:hypothetical protein
MKRIYNYRTNKLYEFEAGGRDYDMTYHHYQRYNETVPELDPIFIELHSIGQRCHNLDKSIEYGAKGNEYVAFDVTGRPTYAFYYAPQIKEEWDYIEHFLANRSPNVYDDQNPTPEELLDLIPHLEMMQRLGRNNKGTMSDLSEICERCIRAIDKYVADFRAKDRTNESLYESEDDVVKFKLCVREEPVNDDVDIDDDDTLDAEYDSMEDALADAEELMREECEIEGFDFDEDCEELEYDGCEDCRVFETPEKRYIFVACPVDEEPNFELEIEDEFDDIPLDDVDEFEDDLEDKRKDESVATRFSRLCNLFESEGEDEEDSEGSKDTEDSEDADNTEEDDDEKADKESDESDDDSEEDEEMKAIAITVKTEDVDACKDELIDAGVAEDDIEVMDDKDGETEIRIDVNSVMELKDYLSKKGIDLEEEIGGEIVSDEDSEDSEGSDDAGEEDPDAEEEVPDYNLDDLGDIFGAEE